MTYSFINVSPDPLVDWIFKDMGAYKSGYGK